jgi:lysophospholipase L1-like esterase
MNTLRIVHMGDSITFGQYVDPALRWTSLVERRLHAEAALQGIAIESVNSGISGNTTRMGLERFHESVQIHRPHVMTLQFGMNDCNCWQTDEGHPRVSLAAFRANIKEMIARARWFGCKRIILQNNHTSLKREPLPSGETYESANARYSAALQEISCEEQVLFQDIRTTFAAMDDAQLARMLLPSPDLLHLSVEGNAVYADLIYPHVRNCCLAALPELTVAQRSAA